MQETFRKADDHRRDRLAERRARAARGASLVNQARFIREFVSGAEAIGVPYNIIEAVDQAWKRDPEGTVGGYWGILDGDRC
jgi:glucan 1,3-beta-glucosidase